MHLFTYSCACVGDCTRGCVLVLMTVHIYIYVRTNVVAADAGECERGVCSIFPQIDQTVVFLPVSSFCSCLQQPLLSLIFPKIQRRNIYFQKYLTLHKTQQTITDMNKEMNCLTRKVQTSASSFEKSNGLLKKMYNFNQTFKTKSILIPL